MPTTFVFKRAHRVAAPIVFAAAAAIALFCSPLQAAPYPERPVRIVLGFTAGGPTDVPARKIATILGASLKNSVIVENKPGAGGKIAAEYTLAQPADGYTLLLCTHVDAANAVLYHHISYTLPDLKPISLISKYNYTVSVAASLPVTSLAEFISYAKKHPGEINYAQVGTGSQIELLAKQFQRLAGIEMTAIPYKGTAEAMQDILAGRTQFIVGSLASTLPLQKQGLVKVLAVTSKGRIATSPNTPSLIEAGIPMEGFGWLGLCGQKGMANDIVTLLNQHIVRAVAAPDYQALIKSSGSIPLSSTPTELGGIIEQTARDAQKVITDFNIRVD